MSNVTVIVPTLNEVENVDLLTRRLLAVQEKYSLPFDILFVDSASKDGTGEKVLAWKERGPVTLLQREVNLGLAGAVIAGAIYCGSEYIVVMDADLSHPPEAVPLLLQPLLDGKFDMVIGSRYIDGGATPDWPVSRRLSSKLATMPALLFCDVRDPLAGFFAVQRWRLVELSRDVPGFKIGLAILAEYRFDLRVKEIPIVFRDRDYGESKMNGKVVRDYLTQLGYLALRRIGRGEVKSTR